MLPRQKSNLHRHHIVPRHMGGSDSPENIAYLSVEDHAEAHRVLWERYNKEEDYIAWKALSGQLTKADSTKKAIINSNKTRVVSEKTRLLIGEKSKGRQSKLHYVTSERTKDKIRQSVKETHYRTDYTKDRRQSYHIMFPDGSEISTDNLEKFCKLNKSVPSPSCIRTQHHREKTEWTRGKYKGFKITKIVDLTT